MGAIVFCGREIGERADGVVCPTGKGQLAAVVVVVVVVVVVELKANAPLCQRTFCTTTTTSPVLEMDWRAEQFARNLRLARHSNDPELLLPITFRLTTNNIFWQY